MDGLELDVCKSGLQQRGSACRLVMYEALQVRHARLDFLPGRWDEPSVPRPRPADPVLAAPEFPWRAVAVRTGHQHPVHLAQEPRRERKILAQACEAMLQGSNVTRNLRNVLQRYS